MRPAGASERVLIPSNGSTCKDEVLHRAEELRDAILKSKLTAADPWAYTPKARAWVLLAQRLVEEIAAGGDRRALEERLAALTAEVEADPDFQEARRRF